MSSGSTSDTREESGLAIRVVLADDSHLVRAAVEHVLATAEGIEAVGSCRDRRSLSEAIEERPDVWWPTSGCRRRRATMAFRSLPTFAARTRRSASSFLSQYSDPRYGLTLLDGGSDGRAYLPKERVQHGGQLVAAIETVAEGGSMIDAKVVESLISAQRRAERSPLGELTPRELEILAFVARGHSNQAIADELVLTKRALEKHINAILLKLYPPQRKTSAAA